ncbi:hypothetical protein FFLO_05715 [Filobasidium floriforme]|uniref:Protein YIP n=1 Tax=Filobasidium floriforme TaxID=5210 RepID=A0A8K0NNK4_9TREE|nr:uncharacterized protein HD553DRAFT_194196 [Filobasidium floriforme]KAG7529363.1 hypothetical protein FFLO_05715 [Filobasidium floriforme]KAH8087320.1 hypothetical protein HD553DRAFT_194196 [Filobasidium floriforme]
MSRTQGYGVVDADDEFAGDLGGQAGSNQLEFQTFLNTNTGGNPTRIEDDRPGTSPQVPFSMFNLTYYQSYFDVDTKTVLQRCLSSFIPKESFVEDVCGSRVDLYGPFWILTTLILTIYLSTSLSTALSAGNTTSDTPTDKDLTLLTFITTLIYLYGLAFPAAFWGVVRYLALKTGGNEGGSEGAAGWSLPEAWAVWGYGMVVWVPISVLCVIPIPILRWILVGAAGLSSGYFLVRNVYPVLSSISDAKLPRTLIIVVIVVHAVVTLIMKYSVGGKKIGPDDPISDHVGEIIGGGDTGVGSGGDNEVVKRWFGL